KLAEGIDSLVLDVKTGSGAFMKDLKDAKKLTQSLVDTAKSFNKKVIAFITDMNQPLGNYVGNWLEVFESIKVLRGETDGDLLTLSTTLSGAMIFLGGKASSIKEGIEISNSLIKSGAAFEKFCEIVKCQGGDIKLINNPEKYPASKFIDFVKADRNGYLSKTDSFKIGIAALELGAGRKTLDDKIDHKAGIIFRKKIGDSFKKGDVIAELHSSSEKKLELAKNIINQALEISTKPERPPKLIKMMIN
ncbi:MAG: thymidine phosphorylase, partial [Ignavibacteriaceae bacterium]|nr:thymidine phosphorylase [Ignavibacteriaceae bacterium]